MIQKLLLLSIILISLTASLGLIFSTVLDKSEIATKSNLSQDCLKITNPSNRLVCQVEKLEEVLKTDDFIAAFNLISTYYQNDLLFQKQCHSFTHIIGERGYDFFSKYQKIDLGNNSSYCGFGFYHGFMEALIYKTNNLSQAREFCNYVADKTRFSVRKAEGSCYHGIGHGVVDGSDPRSWGDPLKIVQPGLELCDKVTTSEKFRFMCAGGIFNSLAIMYRNSENGLQRNQEDPFKICFGFEGYVQSACLNQMNTFVVSLSDKDQTKAGRFVEKISVYINSEDAMDSTMSYFAASNQNPTQFEDIIRVCQNFRTNLINSCISGYAAGLIEFAQPDKEYEAAINFCQSDLLSAYQENECFKRVFGYLKVLYPPTRLESICSSLDFKYRVYCKN